MGIDCITLNFLKELDSNGWLFHASFGEIRFLKWRDVINSIFSFLAISKEFSERLPVFKLIFFFLKIKKDFNKNRYFMSQLFIGVLDQTTHLQFDANCGKIRYVSDP